MHVKEVSSTNGKKEVSIKKMCKESDTHTNFQALATIIDKLEDINISMTNSTAVSIPSPRIIFTLVVPTDQCGSLFGKGSYKMREI